ncbi:hypothetical protein IJG14_08625, partial [bacterium]|nr:hypothetical protein [bacterium]
MAEKKKKDSDSNIYEYIKSVDEKVMNNDKIMKFMSSMQSEQMKELIQSKTDNLKRFFEEAIRLQTEVIRNSYEEIIDNLKKNYEQEIKNIEVNNIKINNQKEETLKAAYENKIIAIKETMTNDFKKQSDENYLLYEREKQALADEVYANAKAEFDKILREDNDKVYNDAKREFEKEKQEALEEAFKNFEREKQSLAD